MENVLTLENYQNIYQQNYGLAVELAIIDDVDSDETDCYEADCYEGKTLKADNLLDLHVIGVDMPETGMHNRAVSAYLMTHLFDSDGNITHAPELIVLVDKANKTLEPYSLSQTSAQSCHSQGDSPSTNHTQQTQLNRYLQNWLLNLKALDYNA